MRGSHKVTTIPSILPVSLIEAKAHLRVDFDDDDDLITALIHAARGWVEEHTNRALITQTVTQVLPCFPGFDAYRNPYSAIRLFRSPVQAITSISYRNEADDAAVTLDVEGSDADIILNTISEPATVSPWLVNMPDGWPTTAPDRPDAVTITFTAGWTSASLVPPAIRHAILLMIGEMYERRENNVKQLPTAAEHLLAPWIVREF